MAASTFWDAGPWLQGVLGEGQGPPSVPTEGSDCRPNLCPISEQGGRLFRTISAERASQKEGGAQDS